MDYFEIEKEKGMDTKTGKPVTKGGTAKNDRAFQLNRNEKVW